MVAGLCSPSPGRGWAELVLQAARWVGRETAFWAVGAAGRLGVECSDPGAGPALWFRRGPLVSQSLNFPSL